jgi:hypothetical protein
MLMDSMTIFQVVPSLVINSYDQVETSRQRQVGGVRVLAMDARYGEAET